MGLVKASYNHDIGVVAEASGYSAETVHNEIVPRALALGDIILTTARTCRAKIVEAMLDAPVLRDASLDNRDRAMILILSGSMVANDLLGLCREKSHEPAAVDAASTHGYDYSRQTLAEIFHVSEAEISSLNRYVAEKVFSGVRKTSQLVENLEYMLGDDGLTPFQKAFIEALVSQHMTERVAQELGRTGGRGEARGRG